MSQSSTRLIGMDVHKATMAVASVAHDHGAAGTSPGPIGTRPCDIEPLVRKRRSTANHLRFADEAGPCGSWLYRDLRQQGDDGGVVAPALMPQTPGDRVKTHRRAAIQLARLARSGDLTAVDVPTVDDAAMRALSRAREDAITA
jgi:transposase